MQFYRIKKLKFNFDLLDHEIHPSIILRNIPDALRSYNNSLTFIIPNFKTFEIDSLKKHYTELSKQYGYDIKIPEERLNRIGFEILRAQYYQKSENILLYCIDLYPGWMKTQSQRKLSSLQEILIKTDSTH